LEGWIELIASTIVSHHISLDQLSQAGANRGGAQAAEFAQLLYGDGLIQAGQDLLDALESLATASFRTGVGNGSGVARHRESQRRTGLSLSWYPGHHNCPLMRSSFFNVHPATISRTLARLVPGLSV
jgi:hypothetical protein